MEEKNYLKNSSESYKLENININEEINNKDNILNIEKSKRLENSESDSIWINLFIKFSRQKI